MQRILLLIVFGILSMVGNLETRDIRRDRIKDTSHLSNLNGVNAFVYKYAMAPRHYSASHGYSQKRSSNITMPRPFVSYWQNLIRNVLPVPSITWNATNPLANLFNAANQDYAPVEREVVDDYYAEQVQRRREHNKTHRKHKRPGVHTVKEQQFEWKNPSQQMQQYFISNNMPMYFYDPSTNAYFAMQRISPFDSYLEDTNNEHGFGKQRPVEQSTNKAPDNESEEETNDEINEAASYESDEEADDGIHLDEDRKIDFEQAAKNASPLPAAYKKRGIKEIQKPKKHFLNDDILRNNLSTFMRDDLHNRQKQRSKDKNNFKGYKQIKPRQQLDYLFFA